MKNNLTGWVFTYNPNTDEWFATIRDNYFTLFNGGKGLLKSKDLHLLIEMISKNGDKIKIEKDGV